MTDQTSNIDRSFRLYITDNVSITATKTNGGDLLLYYNAGGTSTILIESKDLKVFQQNLNRLLQD